MTTIREPERRTVAGTSLYLLIFRTVHILAAIAWAGSVFLLVAFVQPSAAAIAPAGAPFMTELLGRRRLVDRLIALGGVTVVGGLFLYWHDVDTSGGLDNFARTTYGTWITIGAVAAIAALAIGVFGTRPRVLRMLAVGRAAAEAGGPTSEQAAEIGAIQARIKVLARTSLALIALATFAMETAQVW
jgi:uncharacterized membrane protein